MKIRLFKDLNWLDARGTLPFLPDGACMVKQDISVDDDAMALFSIVVDASTIQFLPNRVIDQGLLPEDGSVMETYQTLVVSIGCLSVDDLVNLDSLSEGDTVDASMVFKRDTGYIIKLFVMESGSDAHINERPAFSDALNEKLTWAIREGFSAIEFNCDCAQ